MARGGRIGEGFLEEVLRARKLICRRGSAADQQQNESTRTRSRTGTPDPHEHGLHTSAISHWNSGSTERCLAPESWVHQSAI